MNDDLLAPMKQKPTESTEFDEDNMFDSYDQASEGNSKHFKSFIWAIVSIVVVAFVTTLCDKL